MVLVESCRTCGKPLDDAERNENGDCAACCVGKAIEAWPETARRLRKTMKAKRISRYNLAKTLSIPLTTMYRYFDAKNPRVPNYQTGRLLVEMIERL